MTGLTQLGFDLAVLVIVLVFLAISLTMLLAPVRAIRYFAARSLLVRPDEATNKARQLMWRFCGLVMTVGALFFLLLVLRQVGV